MALSSVALSACALLGDPIAEKVADAIDKYCEEPQRARELYRETINDELRAEGHTILVTCAGDAPEIERLSVPVTNDLTQTGPVVSRESAKSDDRALIQDRKIRLVVTAADPPG